MLIAEPAYLPYFSELELKEVLFFNATNLDDANISDLAGKMAALILPDPEQYARLKQLPNIYPLEYLSKQNYPNLDTSK